eukprot:m.67345 g.67345  ORF g.67345 m.67345 type:complete len:673 (+) comp7674_c0_seq1:553-2571(+)
MAQELDLDGLALSSASMTAEPEGVASLRAPAAASQHRRSKSHGGIPPAPPPRAATTAISSPPPSRGAPAAASASGFADADPAAPPAATSSSSEAGDESHKQPSYQVVDIPALPNEAQIAIFALVKAGLSIDEALQRAHAQAAQHSTAQHALFTEAISPHKASMRWDARPVISPPLDPALSPPTLRAERAPSPLVVASQSPNADVATAMVAQSTAGPVHSAECESEDNHSPSRTEESMQTPDLSAAASEASTSPAPAQPVLSTQRITVFPTASRRGGKLLRLPDSLEALLEMVAQTFACDVAGLLTPNGAEVTSFDLIRDGDELILREAPRQTSAATNDASTTNASSAGHMAIGMTPAAERSGWIQLNVGGKLFATTRDTLMREPDSMLAAMFRGEFWNSHTDASGAILIDRSPRYFAPLLNFLRDDEMIIDAGISLEGVLAEARFFGLTAAMAILEEMIEERDGMDGPHGRIRRQELVRLLLATPASATLRCQGLNFSGADLSRLDLSHINFKFANLKGCRLVQCNLEHCSFEQANLEGAVLDGSSLLGCTLQRANLSKASLRNCNFHDPSQCSHATLEGAILKSADLEDSNLGAVNMRVASFKSANLANCNLRCANMAGTDLGDANLTGCNLQGANLRGANTDGAKFHRIVAAIHMAQSVYSHVRNVPNAF